MTKVFLSGRETFHLVILKRVVPRLIPYLISVKLNYWVLRNKKNLYRVRSVYMFIYMCGRPSSLLKPYLQVSREHSFPFTLQSLLTVIRVKPRRPRGPQRTANTVVAEKETKCPSWAKWASRVYCRLSSHCSQPLGVGYQRPAEGLFPLFPH